MDFDNLIGGDGDAPTRPSAVESGLPGQAVEVEGGAAPAGGPATVQDEATFQQPHRYATGFAYVLVNGVIVVEKDRQTGARPGQILRPWSSRTRQ
jgi:hypothetical protein